MKIDYIPIAMASGGDAMCNYADVARYVPTKRRNYEEKNTEKLILQRL